MGGQNTPEYPYLDEMPASTKFVSELCRFALNFTADTGGCLGPEISSIRQYSNTVAAYLFHISGVNHPSFLLARYL